MDFLVILSTDTWFFSEEKTRFHVYQRLWQVKYDWPNKLDHDIYFGKYGQPPFKTVLNYNHIKSK